MDPRKRIEELMERRDSRRAALAEKEAEQLVVDLEALEKLESELDVRVRAVVVSYQSGFPTRAFVRTPGPSEYKRYKDTVQRAVSSKNDSGTGVGKALDQLARACWIYPTEQVDRDAMLAAFPGILGSIATVATELGEGKAEEEGKG